MEASLKELFDQVERYVLPIVSKEVISSLSKDENKVLALQNIHRLNQKIGLLGRSNKEIADEMKTLQTYVNSITIGIRNDNVPQVRYGLSQARNLIASFS
jgi:hypothetical protein